MNSQFLRQRDEKIKHNCRKKCQKYRENEAYKERIYRKKRQKKDIHTHTHRERKIDE